MYEYLIPFKAVIFDLDKPISHKLPEPVSIRNSNVILCIRNVDKDRISGYVRFLVDESESDVSIIQQIGEDIINDFKLSLKLKNLRLDDLEIGRLEVFDRPQNEKMTVRAGFTQSYRIENYGNDLSYEDISIIHKTFVNINTDGDLQNILHSLDIPHGEKLVFLALWTMFNTIYDSTNKSNSQLQLIKQYIKKIPNQNLIILKKRNIDIIVFLSKLNIVNYYTGDKYSAHLTNALKLDDMKEIIKNTVYCLYIIRNNLVHKGMSIVDIDFHSLSNFLYELIHNDIYTKYDAYDLSPKFP